MAEVAKIESKYERLRKIGIGSYGVVFKCVNRQSGQIVAIKRYSENDTDPIIRKIAMREVRMLRQLKHPNLIQLIEVFRRKRRLHLVFDYCELTVLDVIEKYTSNCPLNLVKKIVWQLVNGVSYCHAHNCIHRDIKPENILINQYGVVKLCDFGFARNLTPATTSGAYQSSLAASSARQQLQAEQEARLLGVPYTNNHQAAASKSYGGNPAANQLDGKENSNGATGERLALTEYVATRWYRAPELLVGDVYYDTKIDIWAIGCVTAELMRGEPVWPGKTDLDQLFMIRGSLGALTASQARTLVEQNLYDQASIERLLDQSSRGRALESATSASSAPLESRLPARVGQAGVEFALVCLRIDPGKRPTSEQLLRHPYIHSARMAQFVKGSEGVGESPTKTSLDYAAPGEDHGAEQRGRLSSQQQSRSNSEALMVAANSSRVLLARASQTQRESSPIKLLVAGKRHSVGERRASLVTDGEERATNENYLQYKRKKAPTVARSPSSQRPGGGGGAAAAKQTRDAPGANAISSRHSLIPISSSPRRLNLNQTTTSTPTRTGARVGSGALMALDETNVVPSGAMARLNQRQQQRLHQANQLRAPASDSASSSSLSVTSGLMSGSRQLARSNGNLAVQFKLDGGGGGEFQSTANISSNRRRQQQQQYAQPARDDPLVLQTRQAGPMGARRRDRPQLG